jgi:hypothetical protein
MPAEIMPMPAETNDGQTRSQAGHPFETWVWIAVVLSPWIADAG